MKYNFVDDPGALLAKYAKEPASVELHVHPTHYRFSHQEGIIPKNHPSIQEFLKSVEQGVILPAATEVFRDSGTRFYEGCIILQIVDYTKKKMDDEQSEPASYRILLEPTDLTLWHDLLYTTDASQGRFTDQQALSMESEILNLTVRHLDLRVPPPQLAKAPLLDSQLQTHPRPYLSHRITKPSKPKPLHRDAPANSGSEYEDFMLLLSDAASQNTTNQFMRLSFIEQLRNRRFDSTQGAAAAAGAGVGLNSGVGPSLVPGVANNNATPAMLGASGGLDQQQLGMRVANPQQIQQLQRQQQLHGGNAQQQQQQPHQTPMAQTAHMSPQISQQMAGSVPAQLSQATQVNSPMMRAQQIQRARMNGMTPAHAQVQQQAHAHAMRSNGINMSNIQGMQGLTQAQAAQARQMGMAAAAQQHPPAQPQGQPQRGVPQNMMNYRQVPAQQQNQQVMQGHMPFSPNLQ